MNKEFHEGDYVQVRSLAWFDTLSNNDCVTNGEFAVNRSDFRRVAGSRAEVTEVDNSDHTIRVENGNDEIWIPTMCVEGTTCTTSRRDRKLKNRVRF